MLAIQAVQCITCETHKMISPAFEWSPTFDRSFGLQAAANAEQESLQQQLNTSQAELQQSAVDLAAANLLIQGLQAKTIAQDERGGNLAASVCNLQAETARLQVSITHLMRISM